MTTGPARPRAGREARINLVDQLRDAIKQSGKSLNQLAKECGVGPDRLSRFMRGERDLTLGAAAEVAEALGYHLAEGTAPRAKKKGT